ncbi:hypothetical protein AAX05_03465 [Moraxella bovoculi]|uniref:DUF4393 domain-containing protein n=1 Tax=Moraxella bovoculi TaxID=386891 RepID=UPI000624787B|nr:DUF4393 domain-containing protein [Moraxella bovoculi]AKG09389.1 hypothetical protein AAX05_03465 [Moraxella bovoculi]AKG13215.1 hypothetical protein AAX11_03215 [Moraxella bovoculi]
MSDNPIQDLAVATASTVIANHAKDAFYIVMGIWYYTFGYQWDLNTEKIRAEHLRNVGEFRNELVVEVNAIAPENIQEPKTSLVGPALEASKFYMDESEIRQMFARLIATSMDKTRSHKAHHAYVEIIKMLSPLDAKNLYYLHMLKDETICNRVIMIDGKGEYKILDRHVWLGNPENPNRESQQVSLENLARLGLVTITYDSWSSDENAYQHHKTHADYLSLDQEIYSKAEQAKKDLVMLKEYNSPIIDDYGNPIDDDSQRQKTIATIEDMSNCRADLQRGMITMTAFGANLCEVCLPTV